MTEHVHDENCGHNLVEYKDSVLFPNEPKRETDHSRHERILLALQNARERGNLHFLASLVRNGQIVPREAAVLGWWVITGKQLRV